MWLVFIITFYFALSMLSGHMATWVEGNPTPNFILAFAFSHIALYFLWQAGFSGRR